MTGSGAHRTDFESVIDGPITAPAYGSGGCHSLARRRSVRCWRCAADLASLFPRSALQRVGRHPARPLIGYQWCLWLHSPPQLSRAARQLPWLGARIPFGGGGAAHGAAHSAAAGAHTCRREAAALAFRRRVRGVSTPHVAPNSRGLLAWPTCGRSTPQSGRAFSAWRSVHEQCEFSGSSHRIFLWRIPLKSHFRKCW